jgi:hypothetical protein
MTPAREQNELIELTKNRFSEKKKKERNKERRG